MEFIILLQLYCFLNCLAYGAVFHNQHGRTAYATRSAHSSNPSIDRLLASPGPQNDVISEDPVAPDFQPSAHIRPIYVSPVEVLNRTNHNPPGHEDGSILEPASTPGTVHDLVDHNMAESPKIIYKRSVSSMLPLPNHWLTPIPKNDVIITDASDVNEMHYPKKEVVLNEATLHYLTPMIESSKGLIADSPSVLRPDGSISQGSGVISEIPSSFSTGNFIDAQGPFLRRLLEKLDNNEEDGSDEDDSGWWIKRSNVINNPIAAPTNTQKTKSRNEGSETSVNDYFADMLLQEILTPPPHYWSSGKIDMIHPIDFAGGPTFEEQKEYSLEPTPALDSEEDLSIPHKVMEKRLNFFEKLFNQNPDAPKEMKRQTLWNIPSTATTASGISITKKQPFVIGMEIKDQNKNARAVQGGLNPPQITPDVKDKANAVLYEFNKLKDILRDIAEKLVNNKNKFFYPSREEMTSKNTDFPAELGKAKTKGDYHPFYIDRIPPLKGNQDKMSQLHGLITSWKEKSKEWSSDKKKKSYILRSGFPFRIDFGKYDEIKQTTAIPEKFNYTSLQKFWQPIMEASSSSPTASSSLSLGIPVNYLKKTVKFLDDLESAKSRANDYTNIFPAATKKPRGVKMTINQDYLNLPPGSEESIQAGAGMAPGKHEGGGLRVKIKIPA